VRGAGLQGVEFVADRATETPFPPSVKPGKVVEPAARARGLLARFGNDFAAFAPPLVITEVEIDEMVSILGESIAAAEPELRRAR
jgi:adenosylmethionine-8-amino-7-oxononanoate aminotransferase